jgi:hypothetical protein
MVQSTHLERTDVTTYFLAVAISRLIEKVLQNSIFVIELSQCTGNNRLLEWPLWSG